MAAGASIADLVSDMADDRVEATISTMERLGKARYPGLRRVFIKAQSWRADQADRLAAAERAGRDLPAADPSSSHPVEGA
ncbi:MAG: hypothetical protein HC871_02520 [Rhizobiales bacterium]|nr:hypothetical protein [Hyphomicrobiales bacterium]